MIQFLVQRPLNTTGQPNGSMTEEILVVDQEIDMIVAGAYETFDNIYSEKTPDHIISGFDDILTIVINSDGTIAYKT